MHDEMSRVPLSGQDISLVRVLVVVNTETQLLCKGEMARNVKCIFVDLFYSSPLLDTPLCEKTWVDYQIGHEIIQKISSALLAHNLGMMQN